VGDAAARLRQAWPRVRRLVHGPAGRPQCLRGVQPARRRQPPLSLQRVFAWSLPAGVLWIAGGLAHDGVRAFLWIFAVLVDYAAPALRSPRPASAATSR